MEFVKATKKRSRARVALIGPSGSGKTFTALRVAHALGKTIALIDSERGSASKYAGETSPDGDVFEFNVLELTSFHPQTYIDAIHAAEKAEFDVLVIDGLSHAWMGKDGALELVDKAAKRSQSGNSFAAWREVTPLHNKLVDAMVQCSCHLIVTMRSKSEWVVEEQDRGGKKIHVPRKVGLAPIQREGLEFEFDVVGDINQSHELVISKSRCSVLADEVIEKPGAELGRTLLNWLDQGEEPVQQEPLPSGPYPNPASGKLSTRDTMIARINELADQVGHPAEAVFNRIAKGLTMDEMKDEQLLAIGIELKALAGKQEKAP